MHVLYAVCMWLHSCLFIPSVEITYSFMRFVYDIQVQNRMHSSSFNESTNEQMSCHLVVAVKSR